MKSAGQCEIERVDDIKVLQSPLAVAKSNRAQPGRHVVNVLSRVDDWQQTAQQTCSKRA